MKLSQNSFKRLPPIGANVPNGWSLTPHTGTRIALPARIIAASSSFLEAQAPREPKDREEFRGWLGDIGAEIEDIEAGAFEKSGTGVKTRMIIATK